MSDISFKELVKILKSEANDAQAVIEVKDLNSHAPYVAGGTVDERHKSIISQLNYSLERLKSQIDSHNKLKDSILKLCELSEKIYFESKIVLESRENHDEIDQEIERIERRVEEGFKYLMGNE